MDEQNRTLYPTLYQRVLGEDFAQLPPVLHAFHSQAQGGQAQGTVRVQHGHGWWRHLLARAFRLPPQGENITVHLQVKTQNEREIWVRHFSNSDDKLCVETVQWQRGDLLIEKAGPLCFAMRVSAHENELHFRFVHNEIAGLKLPFAIMRVNATANATANATGRGGADENRWHIHVIIEAPLVGLLAEYRGEIAPC